ncbi:hypothetical protein ASG21_15160 [Chryseobacterium sp. Leaf394]|nr:hypothetical protein ASG21_15160 [Chryseobacterium sp. Leaf394]
MTSETEALRNFEEFPLRNLQCLSGGKINYSMIKIRSRPSFGDFRRFFKILAEFPGLEFLVLLLQGKRTEYLN